MLYYIYRWLTKHNLHTLSLSDIAANTSFRVVVHFLFAAQLRREWWQVQTLTLQQQWNMNCYSSKRITQVSQFQILKYIYIYFFKGWIRLPAEILYTHSAYIHNLLQQDDQVRTITIPGSLPIRGLLKLKEFYTAG